MVVNFHEWTVLVNLNKGKLSKKKMPKNIL